MSTQDIPTVSGHEASGQWYRQGTNLHLIRGGYNPDGAMTWKEEVYPATEVNLRTLDVGYCLKTIGHTIDLREHGHIIVRADDKSYIGYRSEVAKMMERDGWKAKYFGQ